MGMGEPFVITNPNEAPAQAEKFRQYIQSPVLTQVDLDIKRFNVYEVEPPGIPDVLAERPVICFGKWRGKPKGTLTLTGFTGGTKYTQRFKVSDVTPRAENGALRYLWARHRIKILGDYNLLQADDERVEVITDLGLKYNLLTQYTSFIAIDSEVRNKEGDVTTVKQPLPLPEGVSDYAVGQSAAPMAKLKSVSKFQMALAPEPVDKPDDASRPVPTHTPGVNKDASEETEVTRTKRVGSKTFHFKNGVWIDAEYSQDKKIIKIKRDSQAYHDLITAIPQLKAYFEIGKHVIVNIGKYSIEIADDGKTELTDKELNQLVSAFKKAVP
jgi:hypothetical protein